MNLTEEQKEAVHKIFTWCMTDEPAMCLTGIAGSGKSTVLKEVFSGENLRRLEFKYENEDSQNLSVNIVATTNKAAKALSDVFGQNIRTLHSFLDLRPDSPKDIKRRSYLVPKNAVKILVIDEASMLDWSIYILLTGIQKWNADKSINEDRNSQIKFLYVGDKYQLPPIKGKKPYIFNRGYREVSLERVMRTQNKYIEDLYLTARSYIPNAPEHINQIEPIRLPSAEFHDLIQKSFTTAPEDSVILGYTNQCVIRYNKMVQNIRGESTELVEGGVYVVNNSCIPFGIGRRLLRTEQRVRLESVQPTIIKHTSLENIKTVKIDGIRYMAGNSEDVRNSIKLLKLLAKDKGSDSWEVVELRYFDNYVADLRPGYAMTIHKSQGSTYKNVFIDVPDILKCRSTELRNRLFYVAISRAQENVYFLE